MSKVINQTKQRTGKAKAMVFEKVLVTASFPPDFFDGLATTLIMRPGETLEVVKNEESKRWPAFVLVINGHGERGWVPKRYLKRQGKNAVAVIGYDTTTLNPRLGETLTVLNKDVKSGWLWCRDGERREGWFPIDSVSPLKGTPHPA